METPEQEFNPDRVLRMVRNDKALQKIWQKVHPQDNRNNAALRSIYNALILGDRKNMEVYIQTK
jgi:hypothetical protein